MRSRASRQPSADVWAKIQLFPLITVIDTRSCHARAGYQRNQLFPHTFFCNLHRSYTTRWHALTSGSCGWFRMQQQLSCWQEVASPLPVSSHWLAARASETILILSEKAPATAVLCSRLPHFFSFFLDRRSQIYCSGQKSQREPVLLITAHKAIKMWS